MEFVPSVNLKNNFLIFLANSIDFQHILGTIHIVRTQAGGVSSQKRTLPIKSTSFPHLKGVQGREGFKKHSNLCVRTIWMALYHRYLIITRYPTSYHRSIIKVKQAIKIQIQIKGHREWNTESLNRYFNPDLTTLCFILCDLFIVFYLTLCFTIWV